MTLPVVDSSILSIAPLVPLLPLLGTALVGVTGLRLLRGASHWPVILGVGGALLCSLVLLGDVAALHEDQHANTYSFYSWIAAAPNVSIDISFRIDPLTAIMLTVISAVSLCAVIYARDDMRDRGRPQRGYQRLFALLGLLAFSMCTLVLAGNFLLLYLAWEAVGLCTYLLIGFDYQRPAAANAARKAFLVNGIGDFAFALGILFIYLWISPHVQAGQSPLDYAVVFANVDLLSQNQRTIIALLLFCGAIGKSAQLPLYVWLPDASQAPSPALALIHSATMVSAGVYLVVRCGPIFAESTVAMAVVASVGAVTALFAATIALAQYDLRRILAYSTISQVGYMFLGAGVFAADAAVFHLFGHALCKALLFLAAGNVIRAMGGVIDVRQFGGLRRALPVTFAAFVIASLALAGFPLFSGFFSGSAIVHAAFRQHAVLGLIALATVVLTALYTFRMVFLAFTGPQRLPESVHAREPRRWTRVALVLLAIGVLGAGYVGVTFQRGGFLGCLEPRGSFQALLAPVVAPFEEASANLVGRTQGPLGPDAGSGDASHALAYLSAVMAVIGIALAYLLYAKRRRWADALTRAAPQAHDLMHHAYYIDEMNDAFIAQPLRRIAEFLHAFDRLVVDRLVSFVAAIPRALGTLFRRLDNGTLPGYAVTMAGGLVVIVLITWLMS